METTGQTAEFVLLHNMLMAQIPVRTPFNPQGEVTRNNCSQTTDDPQQLQSKY